MSTSIVRAIVQPQQLDLDSPGRRDYYVALEHDTIWGDHLIPLSVWVGPDAVAGQGLVAFGANHGNEYEGPVALKNLLSEIEIETVSAAHTEEHIQKTLAAVREVVASGVFA